jgi:GNAT superfamily N-acetyltransferase
MDLSTIIKRESELSEDEIHFVDKWRREYFGDLPTDEDSHQAPVHWRVLGRCDDALVSHAAISRMKVSVNGEMLPCKAIGGLLTHPDFQGKGFGNLVMDAAEQFVFEEVNLILLFCLKSLRPFYAKRGWQLVTEPVLLEQSGEWVDWTETTMVLTPDGDRWRQGEIRVYA